MVLEELKIGGVSVKVVVAIDSWKGSLGSLEAAASIAEGVQRVFPEAEVLVRPLADGGEGTVEALVLGMNGRMVTVQVTGPLGIPVEASYGIIEELKEGNVEREDGIKKVESIDICIGAMHDTPYANQRIGECISKILKIPKNVHKDKNDKAECDKLNQLDAHLILKELGI